MLNPKQMCQLFIIDDDEGVRDSMRWLLEANEFKVKVFPSAESFLMQYEPQQPGILIADIRMPGMSGIELQKVLIQRGSPMPILFVTGHGDVSMAVQTMKDGAVDFLEKPFKASDLRDRINQIVPLAVERYKEYLFHQSAEQRLSRLTSRERQVLKLIIQGRLNKQIADDLNISIKTVEAHRSNIMSKLEVSTVQSLMKIALKEVN